MQPLNILCKLVYLLRNIDLVAICEICKLCRHIDHVAINIFFFNDDLAKMNAYANMDLVFAGGIVVVVGTECALHLYGGPERI